MKTRFQKPCRIASFKPYFKGKSPKLSLRRIKSISDAIVRRIAEQLPNRSIELEVGLETADSWIGTHILNKRINLTEFEMMIAVAHRYGMSVTVNLLLGMPFFTEAAQLADTKNSIRWALSKNVDYIIVFPLNIHPYTLFEWLYQNGCLQPPSLWLAVQLLSELNDFELNHVSMAWYGNRSVDYGAGQVSVLPKTCDACRDVLLSFFEVFYATRNLGERKKQIEELLRTNFPCNCREKVFQKLSTAPEFLSSEYQAARHKIEGLVSQYEHT